MKTIVILGGGYAGINLIHSLKKDLSSELGKNIRIILVDKQAYHFRKVLLFRAITEESELKIPFQRYLSEGVEFVQGEVLELKKGEKKLCLKVEQEQIDISYDYLVIALGSVMKENPVRLGGIQLTDLNSAHAIRKQLNNIIEQAKSVNDVLLRKELLSIAVVGGGISGIETVAELAVWFKEQLRQARINPAEAKLFLFDPNSHLLHNTPLKVSLKLERKLNEMGVQFVSNARVKEYKDGQIYCVDGRTFSVGACIVTTGTKANPIIQTFHLPVSENNQLIVDDCYCVEGYIDIFAIGDCARVIDSNTQHIDGMTCKEAIPQAQRLSKIIKSKVFNIPNRITHQEYPVKLYCISLGPKSGFVWVQKWGMNFILSDKLGLKLREYTWEQASLL
ncbi:NAD(P)/FAD-dependent oxidoreductase [Microbacteriaceae bacterium 4G12]